MEEFKNIPNCGKSSWKELLFLLIILLTHENESIEESTKHKEIIAEEVELLVTCVKISKFFTLEFLVCIWVFSLEQFFVRNILLQSCNKVSSKIL